jgi:hypothetical protein
MAQDTAPPAAASHSPIEPGRDGSICTSAAPATNAIQNERPVMAFSLKPKRVGHGKNGISGK